MTWGPRRWHGFASYRAVPRSLRSGEPGYAPTGPVDLGALRLLGAPKPAAPPDASAWPPHLALDALGPRSGVTLALPNI